jgi:hypothetical protein
MKGNNMKTITLNVKGTSQSQWSTFILELNLMKKAWKRYGVGVELKTPSVNKIISQGTNIGYKQAKPKKTKPHHMLSIFGK